MTTLVTGANGATGQCLVEQLLNRGQHVKVMVRSSSAFPDFWENHHNVTVLRANISEMSTEEMAGYLKECQAVASCLGHNMTLKGIFGKPGKLVKDTVHLICTAIRELSPDSPVRFVLMNTAGNRNRDLDESVSLAQKIVVAIIRRLLPPHSDNEDAADYLRVNIGQDNEWIEWVIVRPDTLVNEDKVTEYEVYPSPVRSAIFNPGKTSRQNVGNFMAKLVTEKGVWDRWKGEMPVIYNTSDEHSDGHENK